jgi:hypothetical protein
MGGPGSGRKRGSGSTRSSTRSGETKFGMKVHKYKTKASAEQAMGQSRKAREKRYAEYKKRMAKETAKIINRPRKGKVI